MSIFQYCGASTFLKPICSIRVFFIIVQNTVGIFIGPRYIYLGSSVPNTPVFRRAFVENRPFNACIFVILPIYL